MGDADRQEEDEAGNRPSQVSDLIYSENIQTHSVPRKNIELFYRNDEWGVRLFLQEPSKLNKTASVIPNVCPVSVLMGFTDKSPLSNDSARQRILLLPAIPIISR